MILSIMVETVHEQLVPGLDFHSSDGSCPTFPAEALINRARYP